MNKTVKILTMLLIAICIISVTSVSFASLSPSSVTANASVNTSVISTVGSTIFTVIRSIAAVASVVLLAFLGVKFMMGSTEEKAGYKKAFVPLIVGLFIVLAASTLGGWIWDVFSNIK